MDANKVDDENCIKLAETHIKEGRYEEAKEILQKSKRLYPLGKANDLLVEVEQLRQIERIKRCGKDDYYGILNLRKENANEREIKKAYRKLVLLVHPDKCQNVQAEDIFKLVDMAYKKQSDGTPDEDEENYDDETTSKSDNDEIRTPEGHWRCESSNSGYSSEPTQSYSKIILISVISCLILWAFISLYLNSGTAYSLDKTSTHYIPKKTPRLKIVYYVETGHSVSAKKTREIERLIESECISRMEISCENEVNNRDDIMWQARIFGDRSLFRKAHYMKMPLCDELYSKQLLL